MSALELVFWVCLLVGLYPYVIYPLCIALLRSVCARPVRAASVTPAVTVVISAHNEALHIAGTVRNKLSQDYPPELLDVMVVSDASTDGTDEVMKRLASQELRVSFLRQEPRSGKTAALNGLVERARGEIIVFSDANSMYRPDAVRQLVAPFADPHVGYSSGRMLYVDQRGTVVGDGCTAYMRYENRLRAWETGVGSIVGDTELDAEETARGWGRNIDVNDAVAHFEILENGGSSVERETLATLVFGHLCLPLEVPARRVGRHRERLSFGVSCGLEQKRESIESEMSDDRTSHS